MCRQYRCAVPPDQRPIFVESKRGASICLSKQLEFAPHRKKLAGGPLLASDHLAPDRRTCARTAPSHHVLTTPVSRRGVVDLLFPGAHRGRGRHLGVGKVWWVDSGPSFVAAPLSRSTHHSPPRRPLGRRPSPRPRSRPGRFGEAPRRPGTPSAVVRVRRTTAGRRVQSPSLSGNRSGKSGSRFSTFAAKASAMSSVSNMPAFQLAMNSSPSATEWSRV